MEKEKEKKKNRFDEIKEIKKKQKIRTKKEIRSFLRNNQNSIVQISND